MAALLLSLLALGAAAASAESGGKKAIAYLANWVRYQKGTLDGRTCQFLPSDVDASHLTHLNYAFAHLNSSFHVVVTDPDNDVTDYSYLRTRHPSLRIFISIGGATSTPLPWSAMARNQAGRARFVGSAVSWARKYGFDGIDIDWEFPATADTPYFTLLMKDLRSAIDSEVLAQGRSRLGLTAATPAGYYTQFMEIGKVSAYLDWFNVMTYDMHGAGWESVTGPHTALYAGDGVSCHDLIRNNYLAKGVPPEKIVLGLAHYGKSWKLTDATKHAYGSPSSGEGMAGTCTNLAGFMGVREIRHFIAVDGATEVVDKGTGTTYAYKDLQFVTYDTLADQRAKLEYVCDHGFGGAMTWELSLDDRSEFTNQIYDVLHTHPNCTRGAASLSSISRSADDSSSSSVSSPGTSSLLKSSSVLPHDKPDCSPSLGTAGSVLLAVCAALLRA